MRFALIGLCVGTNHASSLTGSRKSTSASSSLAARLTDSELTGLLEQLIGQSDELVKRVQDLERVTPKEFEVLHYNVLADQVGTNKLPWFCYGAGLTNNERKELHARFYAAGDANKRLLDKGWPGWARGVLSDERIQAVQDYDRRCFAWESRAEKLWQAVSSHKVGCRVRSPDIITLAECDHFDDFWRGRFDDAGFDAVWRKRPRQVSHDGCTIAWRRSTFELVASGGYNFGSRMDSQSPDRTCAFALLSWRRDPTVRVLVATTHLARSPMDEDQQMARGFQYGSLFRELLAFAGAHDAEEVPVVLTGDLNAKDCDELAGTARALVRLLSSPTHPLMWSVTDVPTPPTTVTEERQLRIDYLLYQSTSLRLTGVGSLPKLSSPIPDEIHPSDHLPVSARLVLKPHWAQVEDDARQWLACVSGTTASRPLSGDALRVAFTYFDKDASGIVSLVQLEAAMATLGFPGLDTEFVRAALVHAGCYNPSTAELGARLPWWKGKGIEEDRSWAMNLEQFVQVYTHAVQHGSSTSARQLEMAFAQFDDDDDGVMTTEELRQALHRMASAPIDEERLQVVLDELSGNDGKITIASFGDWMMNTYKSFLEDPSRVQDSITKWPDFVYNQ
uniref:EF-hand domain-containing protein n=2 Tax=Coccolithus braarudii TaxID=221442 RepID=A0A7S0L6X9_9EUKA|mmetsp:Transcript_21388/g.45949  ORF Transcript_21388/g.45949 Transcript_21388/m.45949 type:complete len:619 (+) Transcript_21388:64-1920(+)